MALTNKQRQALFTKNKIDAGFVRYRIWIKPEHKPAVKEFVEKLEKTEAIYIKVTPEEKAEFQAWANAGGESLSSFIRGATRKRVLDVSFGREKK